MKGSAEEKAKEMEGLDEHVKRAYILVVSLSENNIQTILVELWNLLL